MRYSRAFLPTLRQTPKEAATVSHALLLRAGYIRMVGAGIYELLPLGLRVLHRVAAIVREEMDRAGAQEMLMPALLPAEPFQQTGRWETFGPTLLRLRDRRGRHLHLAPTHEEIVTDLVRREIRSYRELPLTLYQIQMKYRDEPRPRAGLLRAREFLMKDAYSFDASEDAARESYAAMEAAYHRIFERLELDYRVVAADSGAMGGSGSAEFQVLAPSGEDAIVVCPSCAYAANVEVARAGPPDEAPDAAASSDLPAPERVHTPGAKTIEQLVAFFGASVQPTQLLKSVAYAAGDRAVLAVVRGDHEVNELELARVLDVEPDALTWIAEPEHAGFLGPVGWTGPIVVDPAAAAVSDAITGANEADHHLRHVRCGRDFEGRIAAIRRVLSGDPCPQCGAPLETHRGIEVGHIFMLGTRYSEVMKAEVLDAEGRPRPIVMGCYGIGVSRLVAAIVEQLHDDHGLVWPAAVAPYDVIVTPLGGKAGATSEQSPDAAPDGPWAVAERIYRALRERGVEVLLDDRAERPGVKLKDADLLGIPLRLTIGRRTLERGEVELGRRREGETIDLPLDACVDAITRRVSRPRG